MRRLGGGRERERLRQGEPWRGRGTRTFRNKNNRKPLQSVVGVDLCSAFLLLTSATAVVVMGRPGWIPVVLCPLKVMAGQEGCGGKDPPFMLGTLE